MGTALALQLYTFTKWNCITKGETSVVLLEGKQKLKNKMECPSFLYVTHSASVLETEDL